MNGAESLVHTLLQGGVDTCFANPGTSEMHFVAALDRVPGMRCVLCLFEGVVTGCADGYGRMAEKPAVTLLHCGPGLANGLANLHNARRANTPIVNIVGDQATYHRPLDPPLTADTEGWARGVSAWVRTGVSARHVGTDVTVAMHAARTSPGQIATLILPADTAWTEGGEIAAPLPVPPRPMVAPLAVEAAARALRSGEPAMLLLGGSALRAGPLEAAYCIAAATGARLKAEGFTARLARGRGRVAVERVPYVVDVAVEALSGIRHLILVGARRPEAFFAYPGKPGYLFPPDADVHVLARREENAAAALDSLGAEVGAPPVPIPETVRPEIGKGAPLPEAVARTVGALLPENAVVVDEAVSFGRGFFASTSGAAPHDWLQVTGGSIGGGVPLATGAAIGAPGRRIVTLQADGSGMYTLQGLWTQAREKLDVTTVILANRQYAILLGELANVDANPGHIAIDMLDLSNPDLNWPLLANGMGVEAARAENCERLADLLAFSFSRQGPFLIELAI